MYSVSITYKASLFKLLVITLFCWSNQGCTWRYSMLLINEYLLYSSRTPLGWDFFLHSNLLSNYKDSVVTPGFIKPGLPWRSLVG